MRTKEKDEVNITAFNVYNLKEKEKEAPRLAVWEEPEVQYPEDFTNWEPPPFGASIVKESFHRLRPNPNPNPRLPWA